jgi:HK97 family phage portal protein
MMNTFATPNANEMHAIKSAIANNISLFQSRASAIEVNSLYQKSHLCKVCAEFWADNIAQVRFRLEDRDGKPVDPKGKDADPLAKMLDSSKFKTMMRETEITMRFFGRSLSRRIQNEYAVPYALSWINPLLFHEDVSPMEGLKGFYIYERPKQDGQRMYYDLDEVVFFREFAFDNIADGVSSAEVVASAAMAGVEVSTTELAFFQNMAMPAAMIMPADDTMMGRNAKEVPALVRFLKSRFQGASNAGKTLVTAARWTLIQLQSPWKDLDMGAQKDSIHKDVAIAFQLAVEFISLQGNGDNLEELIQIWLDRQFRPRTLRYADFLTDQLCTDHPVYDGYKIIADISELVRGDEMARFDIISKQAKGSFMTIDEAQRRMNLPVLEETKNMIWIGDILVPLKEAENFWKTMITRQLLDENGNPVVPTPPQGQVEGPNTHANDGETPSVQVDSAGERIEKRLDGVKETPKIEQPRASMVDAEESKASKSAFLEDVIIGDDVWKELNVMSRKAAKSQVFIPNRTTPDLWTYAQQMAGQGKGHDDILQAVKALYIEQKEQNHV